MSQIVPNVLMQMSIEGEHKHTAKFSTFFFRGPVPIKIPLLALLSRPRPAGFSTTF
jgi:hypothetical protein